MALGVILHNLLKGEFIVRKLNFLLLAILLSIFLAACDDNEFDDANNEVVSNLNTNDNTLENEGNDSTSDKESEIESELDSNDEVKGFVEYFNNLASLSDDVEAIDDTGEIDDSGAQVLYSSNEYGIIAIYDENESLDNYSVVISKSEPYEKLEGSALNATLHVSATLDLDYSKLTREFEEALSKAFHSYFEDDYLIAFFNHKMSGQSDFGMVIEFSLP